MIYMCGSRSRAKECSVQPFCARQVHYETLVLFIMPTTRDKGYKLYLVVKECLAALFLFGLETERCDLSGIWTERAREKGKAS